MKKVKAILATTNVDRHGDRISIEALKGLKEQIKKNYFPVGYMHDIRIPPIGRITDANIIPLKEGGFGLLALIEQFESSDRFNNFNKSERTIPIRSEEISKIRVLYDNTFREDNDQELISELSAIAEKPAEKELKKALVSVQTLIIIAGVFILGQICKGFFSKLGSDLYDKLKNTLINYYKKKRLIDTILDLCFCVKYHDNPLEVHLILSRPSNIDIEQLFDSKFKGFDEIIQHIFEPKLGIVKIVIEYKENRYKVLYAVRKDGIPMVLETDKNKNKG